MGSRFDWERIIPIILIVATGLLFVPILWILVQTYVPPPTEGDVTQREFVPAHREEDPDLCVSYDKNGSCTFKIPQSHWEPDAWFITIYGCGVSRDGKTRCRDNHIKVSESLYELCEPGSKFEGGTCPPR